MDFTETSSRASAGDISKDQMEDLPQSISQKPRDDGQTESGTIMQSLELNTEHDLVIAREDDRCESPMDEDSCKTSAYDYLESDIEIVREPSDDESSSGTAVNRPEMTSDTFQTVNKPPRTRKDKQSLEFQYEIIRFMKEYYELDPSAPQVEIKRAMIRRLNLKWSKAKLSIYLASMIKSYRDVRGVTESQNCSFEDLDEDFYQQCPFYKELDEALQLSDFYRNDNGKRGRPRNVVSNKELVRRISCLPCGQEKIDNVARTRVRNKTPKTNWELVYSNTESSEDEDQLSSEMMDKDFIPSKEKRKERERSVRTDRAIIIARFMKEYFKKNPSSSKTQMVKAYGMQTKSLLADTTIRRDVARMIRTYRELRLCDGFKSCSSSYKKKLISERCPFFDDIHEAYQYSDFYRNSNWTTKSRGGRPPCKTKEFQPTTRNASTDDEMETADGTAVCFQSLSPVFPKPVKRPSDGGDNDMTVDLHLERSLNEKEVMNVVSPLETPDSDHKQAGGDDAAIETPPMQVPVCDHKQDSINELMERHRAIVKNPAIISELSGEQQLELMKLEDRREERQMQMMKMQQEFEIKKLKLQIKYERVKNLKQ